MTDEISGALDAGLFGYIDTIGAVKNLTVITSDAGVSCSGKNAVYSGIIAGRNEGRIENCHTIGSAKAVLIEGGGDYSVYCGGIVGVNDGTLLNCTNDASVTSGASNYDSVGGIVGTNNGTISNCANNGRVEGARNVGGIVGYIGSAKLSNCTNSGEVKGGQYAGGIIGYAAAGSINNCFSYAKSVSGNTSGGVAGTGGLYSFDSTFTNCAYIQRTDVPDKGIGYINNNAADPTTQIEDSFEGQIAAALSASIDTKTIPLDKSATITLTTLPGRPDNAFADDGAVRNVTPDSSDENVATAVYNNGTITITPKGKGTATITVTAERYVADFSSIGSYLENEPIECKFVFPVTVTNIALEGIKIPAAETLQVGASKQISITYEPEGAANKNVKWTSDNPAVATVDEKTGTVTGVSEGTAVITAISEDGGHRATCEVTVTEAPAATIPITFADGTTPTQLETGKEYTFAATAPTGESVTWRVEGAQYRVNADGTLTITTGDSAGTVTITAEAGEWMTEIRLTVAAPQAQAPQSSGGGGGGCSAGFGALALLAIIPLAVRRKK